MAKHRYGKKSKKGHRKSAKRVAAGQKAARTRKRNAAKRHGGGRKHVSSRRRNARKGYLTMCRRYGGKAKYDAILRARLAKARRAR